MLSTTLGCNATLGSNTFRSWVVDTTFPHFRHEIRDIFEIGSVYSTCQSDIRNLHSLLAHNRIAANVAWQMGLVMPHLTQETPPPHHLMLHAFEVEHFLDLVKFLFVYNCLCIIYCLYKKHKYRIKFLQD